MKISEALKLERLKNDDERAYKILSASFVSLKEHAGKLYYANASKTKQKSIRELSTLTNPLVRCFQKTTYYVNPAEDDNTTTLIENHKTGTNGAADKGHELYSESGDKRLLAMQFFNNCFPSEQALMSGVAAHDVELDLESAFGTEVAEAAEHIFHGLYLLAENMLEVDEQELPKASKQSGTQKTPAKDVKAMEKTFAEVAKVQESQESEESQESPAKRKARLEELQQVKYIGSATASALLDMDWHWKRLKELSTLHGKDVALSKVEDVLNERQRESLREALPAQVG